MYIPVRRRMCSSEERVLILLSSYVALPLARPLVAVLAIASIRGLYVERAAIPRGGTRPADNGRLEMQEKTEASEESRRGSRSPWCDC